MISITRAGTRGRLHGAVEGRGWHWVRWAGLGTLAGWKPPAIPGGRRIMEGAAARPKAILPRPADRLS